MWLLHIEYIDFDGGDVIGQACAKERCHYMDLVRFFEILESGGRTPWKCVVGDSFSVNVPMRAL